MKKSEFTKQRIIKESSVLFNMHGYKNTSLSEINDATGYTKGAIYRHFKNKETLEIEAFEYLANVVANSLKKEIKSKETAFDKLEVIFNYFNTYITSNLIKGGCPLLNVAIEVDESESVLRNKAKYLLNLLKKSIEDILNNGIKHNQINSRIDVKNTAIIMIASLEGAIMMSKLNNSTEELQVITTYLKNYMLQYKS